MTEYRIRWDRIEHIHSTYKTQLTRMCIAEKKIKSMIGSFWLPLVNGNWRFREEEAERDIESDKALYAPLPPEKYFELVEKSA